MTAATVTHSLFCFFENKSYTMRPNGALSALAVALHLPVLSSWCLVPGPALVTRLRLPPAMPRPGLWHLSDCLLIKQAYLPADHASLPACLHDFLPACLPDCLLCSAAGSGRGARWCEGRSEAEGQVRPWLLQNGEGMHMLGGLADMAGHATSWRRVNGATSTRHLYPKPVLDLAMVV